MRVSVEKSRNTAPRGYLRAVSVASRDGAATDEDAALAARLVLYPQRQLFLTAMAAPALIYVLAVAVGPMVQGFLYSFDNYNLIRPASRHFVGLDNYLALWRDPTARRALINTFAFTFGAVTLEFVLGLGVALLLWRDDWFNRVALGLLLIPATVTPLVVGLVFKALLSPEYGMLGYPLAELGLSSPRGLLADPQYALATLVAIDAWEWTPLMALILLAGLKTLPTDILEAAAVDGANGPQRFWLMVLPLLAARGLSRANLAHDGRLPGVRHHLRHHQRRPGGCDQHADDLWRQTGARVFQHRRRFRRQHIDRRLHPPHGRGVHRGPQAGKEPACLIAIGCC